MYTMQKLGDATDENGNLKLFYGIVTHIFLNYANLCI